MLDPAIRDFQRRADWSCFLRVYHGTSSDCPSCVGNWQDPDTTCATCGGTGKIITDGTPAQVPADVRWLGGEELDPTGAGGWANGIVEVVVGIAYREALEGATKLEIQNGSGGWMQVQPRRFGAAFEPRINASGHWATLGLVVEVLPRNT